MRYLGVDPGGKRLGLAVGDDATGVASPLRVEPCSGAREAADIVVRVLVETACAAAVIGLPTAVDGSETPACARSRALARHLEARGVTVRLQPEHLSTDEARRRARAAGRQPRAPVDDLAAQVLLEEYLAEPA